MALMERVFARKYAAKHCGQAALRRGVCRASTLLSLRPVKVEHSGGWLLLVSLTKRLAASPRRVPTDEAMCVARSDRIQLNPTRLHATWAKAVAARSPCCKRSEANPAAILG